MKGTNAYHANFILGDSRQATVIVPRDITESEAAMIANVLCKLAERSHSHDHAAAYSPC